MSDILLEVKNLKQYFPVRAGLMKTIPLKAVDDEDEDGDEEDDDFVELQCPECGETIYFDEDMLESGEELLCPNCNALLVPTLEEDDDGEE